MSTSPIRPITIRPSFQRDSEAEAARPTLSTQDTMDVSCCSRIFETLWARILAILNYFGFCLSAESESELSTSTLQMVDTTLESTSLRSLDPHAASQHPLSSPIVASSITRSPPSPLNGQFPSLHKTPLSTPRYGDDSSSSDSESDSETERGAFFLEGTAEYACATLDLASLKEYDINPMKASSLLFSTLPHLTSKSTKEDFNSAIKILDYLFEQGAFVNTTKKGTKNTIIIEAAMNDLGPILEYLLARNYPNGGILLLKNSKGKTAKDYASASINTLIQKFETRRSQTPQGPAEKTQRSIQSVPHHLRSPAEVEEKTKKQEKTVHSRFRQRLQYRQGSAYFQSLQKDVSSTDGEPSQSSSREMSKKPEQTTLSPQPKKRWGLLIKLGIGRRPEKS